MTQGTPEWRQARCGKFTASRIADLLARTKSGPSATRRNYIAEIVVERLTGEPQESGFVSAAMQRGIDLEPEARTAFEFEYGVEVTTTGFIEHPTLPYTGGSPDGLIGADGIVEIKCPNTATHIETLRTQTVPKGYYAQIQWNIECAGRSWGKYISYDPRLQDPRLTLFVKHIEHDQVFIEAALSEVKAAEREVNQIIDELTHRAGGKT
jgi:putative phage-type endonuclease